MPLIQQWPIPTADGIQLQFADIALGLDGTYFPFITDIAYDHTLEPGEARGTSPYPMGTTLGEYKAHGHVTIQRIWRELFFNIIERQGPGTMDKFIPFVVTYQQLYWPTVEVDDFRGRITGQTHEGSHGNGVLLVRCPLYIPFVRLNGHVPTGGIPV